MKVQVINKSNNELPKYETELSSGLDVRAYLSYDIKFGGSKSYYYYWKEDNKKGHIVLYPNERVIIPTGLFVSIPEGYEIQVRPRSGLAFKKGITVLNTPGTIDADYRNEIGVILINHGPNNVVIEDGDRIAQLVLCPIAKITWEEVDKLDETNRLGGFGTTGIK